ncbi:MAG: MOP flippase family protein [Anaerolineales bacterium]|nr:MOP flippase family protein [Anaerolineales bacterium]
MTLRAQAVSSVKWSALSQAGRQGTLILTTIILARLLAPSDFGLLGMAMVVIGFIEIFKDLGTTAAIIQKKELSEALLSSIFWVNVGFGMLAMAVLFFSAPLGGLLYHEPGVVAILQVLSLSFFISSLSILQQALLQRLLAFQALARVEVSAVLCGAIVGIALASYGAGVWSLVFQSLITASITTIFLWFSSSWRPQRVFHWDEVKSVSSFSLNLVGFNIFNYFSRNADYFLIGRYLGAQDLGYYTLAYRILLFPLQNISSVIGRVMYPVYSGMQDDNHRFSTAYLKVMITIAFIVFPMMFGVLVLASPFVLVIFGENWRPAILLIMIFAPIGLLQSINAPTGFIYQAKGRTDWLFRWGIGSGMFVVIAFIIGLQWGVVGVAVAYAIAVVILLYPSITIPFSLIDLKFIYFIQALYKPFFNSLVMFLAVMLFQYFLPRELSDQWVLGLSIGVGMVVYAVMSWLVSREQLKELWRLGGFVKNAQGVER